MPDPPGAPPPPPPGQPPAAPPPAGTPWQAPKAAEPIPGAPGFYYAGVLYRIVALIIDAIIIGIVGFVLSQVIYSVVGQPYDVVSTGSGIFDLETRTNIVPLLIGTAIQIALSAAYFIFMWTSRRATLGQQILGMQVGNFPDGKTLSQDQAIRRWAVLFLPSQVLGLLSGFPGIGALLSLLSLGYALYLLYTTYSSPTKQGFHDKFANTVVVAAARSAT